jgi:pectinesterase
MIGENKFKTILTYDDHTGTATRDGKVINTMTSHSFIIKSDNFTARNLTIQNNAGFNAGQAVALESDGDKAQFYDCRFVGFQDVLFTKNIYSRQYYKDCYIEGTTDFIFGPSTVWFEHCHIHSKKNSHVTAASTPQDHGFGYVFNDCILTGDTSLHSVSLGRPWRPYASVTYIHCYLGPQIKRKAGVIGTIWIIIKPRVTPNMKITGLVPINQSVVPGRRNLMIMKLKNIQSEKY